MSETLKFDLEPEEVEVFCLEAEELIQNLDEDLLNLEQNGNDPATVQRIFRAAHSLKGAAGTIAHHRMANLTHTMETLLDQLRQGRLAVSSALVDLLLESADGLKLLSREVSTREYSGFEPAELIRKLQTYTTGTPQAASAPAGAPAAAPAESEPAQAAGQGESMRISVQISPESIAPAARAMQVIMALRECGTIQWTRPTLEAIEESEPTPDVEVLLTTTRDVATLRQSLHHIGEISDIEINNENEKEEPESPAVEPASGKSGAGHAPVADVNLKTVRTSVERLDKLMNLVGELVTDRNRLLQAQISLRSRYQEADLLGELSQAIAHLASITDELQEEVMRARMLPLERVFSKFPRMIRDLARDMGKQVNLVIEGQETELDRSVIEQISDPLMHLLRNSVDHGIEPPEERKAAGKPEIGTIRLTGRSEGNHIIITVADDGHGINLESVRKSAIARGTINEDAASRLTESEIIDLIFTPGLSTAKRVTDVSGRGVGMDVVLHQIERLHGTVSVSTRLGLGSTFELSLPLTLAIMPVLLVNLCGITFCIPLSAVTEVLEVDPTKVHPVERGEVMLWRSKLLPLVKLRRFFGLDTIMSTNGNHLPVVAVHFGEEHAGLVVDHLLGQQEIVIKNLGSMIGQVPGITGATILGDGSVALIVDVPGLIKQASRAQQ